MDRAGTLARASEAVVEQWIERFEAAVVQTCFVMLRDHSLAQDAAQDTFLKAWQRYGQFEGRGESSEKTWIMRIAINTCKDYRRSAWFRHVDMEKAIEDIPLAAPDVTGESRVLFLDVMRLPPRLKQVILLYHFHNLTMAETAEALHISRQAVQYRLKKAYQLLGGLPERSVLDE